MLDVFRREGIFSMLAFDHRSSFIKLLTVHGVEPTRDEVIQVKKDILQALVPYMTSTLIDEDYGVPALQSLHSFVPYLLPLEKTGYTEKQGERITEILTNPKDLIKKGAQGVKLLLYTNHNVPSWDAQIKIAKNQSSLCKEAGTPFFLEFVLYSVNETKPGTIFETVQKAIQGGVTCDVWKIPYPGSQEECEKITKLLGETPWILLTGGTVFDEFNEQYHIARSAGCRGFLAGRALWQEVGLLWKDHKKYREFLECTLPERFKSLLVVHNK